MEKKSLNDKRFELDLLYTALISFEWLFNCKYEYSNTNPLLKKTLFDYEKTKGGPIINAGTLLSFAYWFLVFANETKLLDDDFIISKLNISNFNVVQDDTKSSKLTDQNSLKKYLIKRIRNSISHGRFEIIDKYIIFKDGKKQKEKTVVNFEVKILTKDFGDFMNQILYGIKQRYQSGI